MNLITGDEIGKLLEEVIYEKTQKNENSFYLTVKKIYSLTGRGELDFGGSELKKSGVSEIVPKKKTADDDYGWWFLGEGNYLLEYNERIVEDVDDFYALIQPAERLTECGAYHPTLLISKGEEIKTILCVGQNGLNIKENSRISRLFLFGSE